MKFPKEIAFTITQPRKGYIHLQIHPFKKTEHTLRKQKICQNISLFLKLKSIDEVY